MTFRVPPFSEDEARRALAELKGFKLLEGVRGQAPVDIDALVDTVMKVQRLALDLAGEVRELDINPLVIRPARRGGPRRIGGEAVSEAVDDPYPTSC